jgi:hypothetical protein
MKQQRKEGQQTDKARRLFQERSVFPEFDRSGFRRASRNGAEDSADSRSKEGYGC